MPWTPWFRGQLTDYAREVLARNKHPDPDQIWLNNEYEVWLTKVPAKPQWPAMIWLSIKRKTKGAIHDWRHLQRIKTELIGPEHEAIELYPAESRHVDTSNQYHLWVLADPNMRFPFGYTDRLVCGPNWKSGNAQFDRDSSKSRQRPFDDTHQPADAPTAVIVPPNMETPSE